MFRNKFTPKKGPTRKFPSMSNLQFDENGKAVEFGIDMAGPVKLNLGGREMLFADGTWISETTGLGMGDVKTNKEVEVIKDSNLRLSEENNLLKIKVELLLDMLSEKTAEVHLKENDLEQMKKLMRKK